MFGREATSRGSLGAEWLIVGLSVLGALGAGAFFRGTAIEGSVRTVDLTLVSADRTELSCALSKPVGKFACGYARPGATAPLQGNERERLAPFVSTDRVLYLAAGLFTEPHLDARSKQDIERKVGREGQQRFVARCEVRFVERVERFYTRWSPRGRWEKSGPAWVIEPRSCVVQ